MSAHTYYRLTPLDAWRDGAQPPVSRFTDAATAKPGSAWLGGEHWCRDFVRARIRGEHDHVALLRYRWDNWSAPSTIPADWSPAWVHTIPTEEWAAAWTALTPAAQRPYLDYLRDGTARADALMSVIDFHLARGRVPVWYFVSPAFITDVRIPEYQDHVVEHAQRSLLRSGADALMVIIKTSDEATFRTATGVHNRVTYAAGEFAAANAAIVSRLLAAGVRIATLEQASPGREWEWLSDADRVAVLGQYLATDADLPAGATGIG